MYICVFIFLPYDKKSNMQLQAGAIAIFLGWINFTWFLKRFPTYGIYIIMTKKIFFTFIKVRNQWKNNGEIYTNSIANLILLCTQILKTKKQRRQSYVNTICESISVTILIIFRFVERQMLSPKKVHVQTT